MHLADDLQIRRRAELCDESPALLRLALVEDHGRDVLRVHVDDAEENQLADRNEEREEERAAIADHLRQLFADDPREAVPRIASARCASPSRPPVAVSSTRTSSSVGPIGCTVPSPEHPIEPTLE